MTLIGRTRLPQPLAESEIFVLPAGRPSRVAAVRAEAGAIRAMVGEREDVRGVIK